MAATPVGLLSTLGILSADELAQNAVEAVTGSEPVYRSFFSESPLPATPSLPSPAPTPAGAMPASATTAGSISRATSSLSLNEHDHAKPKAFDKSWKVKAKTQAKVGVKKSNEKPEPKVVVASKLNERLRKVQDSLTEYTDNDMYADKNSYFEKDNPYQHRYKVSHDLDLNLISAIEASVHESESSEVTDEMLHDMIYAKSGFQNNNNHDLTMSDEQRAINLSLMTAAQEEQLRREKQQKLTGDVEHAIRASLESFAEDRRQRNLLRDNIESGALATMDSLFSHLYKNDNPDKTEDCDQKVRKEETVARGTLLTSSTNNEMRRSNFEAWLLDLQSQILPYEVSRSSNGASNYGAPGITPNSVKMHLLKINGLLKTVNEAHSQRDDETRSESAKMGSCIRARDEVQARKHQAIATLALSEKKRLAQLLEHLKQINTKLLECSKAATNTPVSHDHNGGFDSTFNGLGCGTSQRTNRRAR